MIYTLKIEYSNCAYDSLDYPTIISNLLNQNGEGVTLYPDTNMPECICFVESSQFDSEDEFRKYCSGKLNVIPKIIVS